MYREAVSLVSCDRSTIGSGPVLSFSLGKCPAYLLYTDSPCKAANDTYDFVLGIKVEWKKTKQKGCLHQKLLFVPCKIK